MQSVVGVIPARYAASRFPGKPLALIQGRPMILWVLEGARRSKRLDRVIVATDDERIRAVVFAAGGEVVMTDSGLPSGTDRVFAAIRGIAADVVVNIQGDEPLIQSEMLDELIAPMLEDATLEMATLGHSISTSDLNNPNSVKVIMNTKGDAIYFSRFPIPYSRGPAVPGAEVCLKHVGLYAYQRHFLETFCATAPSALELGESLEQLRALDLGARIRVVKTNHRSQGVDTPEDLAKIEDQLQEK